MASTAQGGRVLVVEDDPSIRLLMREMLRSEGLEAIEAADGKAALAAAREHAPEVILLDIGLPGVDGLTVLRRLKSDPALAEIPVIMVTAWVEPEYVERAMEGGAHGYVRKPFDTGELVARVQAARPVSPAGRRAGAGSPPPGSPPSPDGC